MIQTVCQKNIASWTTETPWFISFVKPYDLLDDSDHLLNGWILKL